MRWVVCVVRKLEKYKGPIITQVGTAHAIMCISYMLIAFVELSMKLSSSHGVQHVG